MTYEEYEQRSATLKAELEALKPAYLAEHGLAIGTPVKVKGEDGLITERDIGLGGFIIYRVRATFDNRFLGGWQTSKDMQ
jgi:hypothetical protein